MSGGGIFLVTVDASKDNLSEELPLLEHWLRFVDSILPCGSARAFIVVTHQDSITGQPEVLESNKAMLQRHFKSRIFSCLECISFVGIQQGLGMKQLQSRLVKVAVSMCNTLPVPYEWKLVAGAIRSAVTRPFLTFRRTLARPLILRSSADCSQSLLRWRSDTTWRRETSQK